MMLTKIKNLLLKTPGVKAREIAKRLNLDRAKVSSLLHHHVEDFQQDSDYCWSCVNQQIIIEFPKGWVGCKEFEIALSKAGSVLESKATHIKFLIPESGYLLLEAIARLMALSNQLVMANKNVTIDFTQQYETLKYVNRLGFFDYLDKKVEVLPNRPKTSTAKTYKENSDNLVELGEINPKNLDKSIPARFKDVFVKHAGEIYEQTAFTVISESYGNVRDHSESPIPGFIGLQFYRNTSKPHIQTVISDSGKGILGTLKPILEEKYPEIANELYESELNSDVLLLKKVFTQGEITQKTEEEGRGLGLKSTTNAASKFNATIYVRQENCEVKFFYRHGKLSTFQHQFDMPTILGTHICFDFQLDQSE